MIRRDEPFLKYMAAGKNAKLFKYMLAVASGRKTWSERWKKRPFQIWTAGKLSL